MTPSEITSRPIAATELRRAFLDFFAARGHTVVPSAPLVTGDPTLLFTTAGMVQFKPYYTTGGEVPYARAVSIQKCLRLTDLERVGLTPRHDTFFEMLGNFSFGARERGAYFKEEAIAFAWDFVTKTLGLPVARLYASIFEGEGNLPRDDEAEALWKKIGLPADHIVPLGRADNFWGPAGGQGACGPCSEIYFDLGERRPPDLPPDAFWGERPGDPGDRYMEFWNLVFPHFDAQPDGRLVPLPRPGIDTGMGIERLAMILQEKPSIFDTDLFEPIIVKLREWGARAPERPEQAARDARVIADHVRALTFAIGEGALPGNEGAGYVLRRLVRRAVVRTRNRQGLAIRVDGVLAKCARIVIDHYGDHYRELRQHEQEITRTLVQEEEHFAATLESGLARLGQALAAGAQTLSGADAFMLHDTYGFPIELTTEIAAERGVAVDLEGFERAMEEQRRRAREGSRFHKENVTRGEWTVVGEGHDSEFLGWSAMSAEGLSLRRWRTVEEPGDPASVLLELVLDRTPFYAEAGGQVADRGTIASGHGSVEVVDVRREDEHIVHRVRVPAAARDRLLADGSQGRLRAEVDPAHRLPTMRHHTATHLLHAMLRDTLGTHVRQAGSLVAPDRLRFDYTHFEAPTREQLGRIEERVNEWILRNREVLWKVMPLDEARALGAMALFGEKYGAEVRMVTVEGVDDAGIPPSRELCGGTHVQRTGDIGAFAIVSDAGVASGVRRIEALTGHETLRRHREEHDLLARAASALQTGPATVPEQIEKLQGELERLRKEAADARRGGLEAEMAELARSATAAPQGRWIVGQIASDADTNAVRDAADRLRGALQRGAAVLAISAGGKVTFLAAVTDDLVSEKKLRADELVRAVAKIAGGSGGGKPHLALAGAKDPSKLEPALAEARRLLEEALA